VLFDAAASDTSGVKSWNVLVADDSPVNLRLVTSILESHGHRVVTVDNGLLAFNAAGETPFDAILMDLDMPEMDGLQATAAIREAERHATHRATIIALTARTLPGAREACTAVGMDGFLGKPISADTLLPLMRELVHAEQADLKGRATMDRSADLNGRPTKPANPPAIDQQDLLERLGGDDELLAELTDIFHAETPRMMAALRTAVDAGDATNVQRVSHTLRGSVAVFGAHAASHAALALEHLARGGSLTGASDVLATLDAEIARLGDELTRLTRSSRA
jgi:CheY-like chemotaxis protein